VAVLNDSAKVLSLLCKFFRESGLRCVSAAVADMPAAHEQIEKFILKHRPDVVVYDVAMPYGSSWDLLDAVRSSRAMQAQRFVVTTPNKRQLEQAVGRTGALEVAGATADLRRLLTRVERRAAR